MKVCFITDENYAVPTMAAIKSLIDTQKEKMSIYVLSTGTFKDGVDCFKLLSTKNADIEVIEFERNPYEDIDTKHAHVSKAALLKFLLPNIFKDLDKILYLDSDILVLDDISDLYNIELADKYAAVVSDMAAVIDNSNHTKLGLKTYFNSGVMLLNLSKMREENLTDKLIENKKNENNHSYMDQDVLNKTFNENVLFVSPNFNLMKANLRGEKHSFKYKQIANFYHVSLEQVRNVLTSPAILHMTNKLKPWNNINAMDFELWFKYFNKVPNCPIKLKTLKFLKKQLSKAKISQILKTIFSIENDEVYKILTILGIKVRFVSVKLLKKKNKELENKIDSLITQIKKRDSIKAINRDKVLSEIENYNGFGLNREENRDKKIIVSLTSYPARMYDVHYAVFSLLNQSCKPDKIILWLTKNQFPNGELDIPKKVLALKEYGLEIGWCEDAIKSYTKLLPALSAYPDAIIVTADDDIYYDADWLKKLYEEYSVSDGKTIIAHRCHKIIFNNKGQMLPYRKWFFSAEDNSLSYLNFLTGVGGVLYPPGVLYKDIFNIDKFRKLSPSADDVWFWAMAVLNGTKIKIIKEPCHLVYTNSQRELGLNDDGTLMSGNVGCNQNDFQLARVMECYPDIMAKLLAEMNDIK